MIIIVSLVASFICLQDGKCTHDIGKREQRGSIDTRICNLASRPRHKANSPLQAGAAPWPSTSRECRARGSVHVVLVIAISAIMPCLADCLRLLLSSLPVRDSRKVQVGVADAGS